MIIVGQDKKDVVVLDNMKALGVRGNKIAITDNITTSESAFVIGKYKTEERAKEVLQDIIERYDGLKRCTVYAQGDSGYTFDTRFYYEMPEE